jgi:hypothetical protein
MPLTPAPHLIRCFVDGPLLAGACHDNQPAGTAGGAVKFFRIWDELNMWAKFGVSVVAAVVIILIILELT